MAIVLVRPSEFIEDDVDAKEVPVDAGVADDEGHTDGVTIDAGV
jgi:hypothetical protein